MVSFPTKIFMIILVVIFCGIFSVVSAADDKYGFEETARKTPLLSLSISKSSPEAMARDIVQKGLFFVGTVFFLLILYGGIIWLISRGAAEKVATAKQILETAIIGLIIVSASYAIATFVFNRLTEGTPDTPESVLEGTQ